MADLVSGSSDLKADAAPTRRFLEFAEDVGLPIRNWPAHLREQAEAAKSDRLVPATLIIDLLQVSALLSGRGDVGVAFSDWVTLRRLGPVSLLWDHCATFHDALVRTRKYMDLENPALSLNIEERGSEVALVHAVEMQSAYGSSQFLEAVIASTVKLGRLILGKDWTGLRVEMSHDASDYSRFKRNFFRCPIVYSEDRCAVVCRREDLFRLSAQGDAHTLAFLEDQMDDALRELPSDFVRRVEALVALRLAGGLATLPVIALLAGVSRRTLQRRLGEAGATFGDILRLVRKRKAEDYLRGARTPNLTQLAYLLGFSDASAASRFVKAEYDVTGRQLRGQLTTASAKRPS